ncbi:MAG: FtsL-like putative cell division protein [Solitalea-like symbiont of Acarus siro]
MEPAGQFLINKIKFWAFLLLIIIIYITNRLIMERLLSNNVKEADKLEDIILNYKMVRAKLMQATSKNEMLKKAKKYGLTEAKKPPIKITVKK